MASVVINGDTSGAVTITAPAVAGTPTLTLPTTTGTLATLTTPSFTTTIGVGAATASASGAGVTFPATQSASSNANTLDDYEEGTFSASCTCSSGSITVNANTCYYTKIGREVSVQGFFTVASVSSPTGVLNINGLPFSGAYRSPCIAFGDGLSGSASGTWVGDINTGTTIQTYKIVSGVVSVTAAADVQASTSIWFQATYFV